MRIDAHQQYWQYNDQDFGWLDSAGPILKQDYLPRHLEPNLHENGLHGTVVIQARPLAAETDFLIQIAAQHHFVKAVVGWVDLTAPNLLATLSRYHGKVSGFRQAIDDGISSNLLLEPAFQRGFAMLSEFGYTFDLVLEPNHLDYALQLAHAFPSQKFVINHLAKPTYTTEEFASWSKGIEALAKCGNAYCKLSGLITQIDYQPGNEEELEIDQFVPFLDKALEAFGAHRLMFGSDWPVCTQAATYDEVYDIISTYSEKLSSSEQAFIMGNTAAEFYQIGMPTT